MERQLAALVNRLVNTFGDRFISAILYGSAAGPHHHSRYSDLNVLCVLTQVTSLELAESESIFRWWRGIGNPAPLLLSERETRASADCFPIEFHDMQERRRVLHGVDVIAGLVVDHKFYRAQLEHELRSNLLRLRQHAAGVLSDRDRLLKLCVDSVSSFCVLGRHALLSSDRQAGQAKREIVNELEHALGQPMPAFHQLLDVREEKLAPQETDPATVFENYLGEVNALVAFVDRIEETGKS